MTKVFGKALGGEKTAAVIKTELDNHFSPSKNYPQVEELRHIPATETKRVRKNLDNDESWEQVDAFGDYTKAKEQVEAGYELDEDELGEERLNERFSRKGTVHDSGKTNRAIITLKGDTDRRNKISANKIAQKNLDSAIRNGHNHVARSNKNAAPIPAIRMDTRQPKFILTV